MKLKRVINNIIPFEGYIALTMFPWVFIRKELEHKYTDTVDRHETTHGHQQIECFVAGAILALLLLFLGCGWWSLIPLGLFWEIYLWEYMVKVVLCFFANRDAYYSICFEQEANEHEEEMYYNDVRKHFAWIKYIFKLVKRRRVYEV